MINPTPKILSDLSKTISHALRHEPWLYELELDHEGWVDLCDMVSTLVKYDSKWAALDETLVEEMICQSDKKRHEIKSGRIRAIYGHSLPGRLESVRSEPPEILYHGTASRAVAGIQSEGLKPMGRQYVHLSVDRPTAQQVGMRKSREPVMLIIEARRAHSEGVRFYSGNEKVWLADFVPSQYIKTEHTFPDK